MTDCCYDYCCHKALKCILHSAILIFRAKKSKYFFFLSYTQCVAARYSHFDLFPAESGVVPSFPCHTGLYSIRCSSRLPESTLHSWISIHVSFLYQVKINTDITDCR